MTAGTFGAELRRHRLATGLTQAALAERAGISTRTVSDLERCINRAPQPDTFALLAEAPVPPDERAGHGNGGRSATPPAVQAGQWVIRQ